AAAPRAAQHPAPGGEIRAAVRERVAAGAHSMDQVLSGPVQDGAKLDAGERSWHARVRGAGRWPDVLDDDAARDGDHRPDGRQALRRVLDEGRGSVLDR